MNTDKSRRLLKKIQALFDNLSDQGTVSSLERDLLLSYMRELYEEFTSVSALGTQTHQAIHEGPALARRDPVVKDPEPAALHYVKEPPAPVTFKPVQARPEHHQVDMTTPVRVDPPASVPEPATMAPATNIPVPKLSQEDHNAVSALFEFKGTGELAEKLTLQPLDRIEHGMGINERILTINELFNGDSALFKQTLERLNNLGGFTEAQEYLTSGPASLFNWTDDTRKNKAAFFIQLVRRRYVNH